ncbi:DUF5990 family protein [Streptomyces sp. NPDC008343]|uniref:DUF5990 family protein n=1 Tax=Streptomyces sp. NPDC008343 TaxID=3364828 RepID=UPI0036E9ABB9
MRLSCGELARWADDDRHAQPHRRRRPARTHLPAGSILGRRRPAYRYLHVAVQRRGRPTELLAPQPGDAFFATWTLDCAIPAIPSGRDVRATHIQGRPDGRFMYLCGAPSATPEPLGICCVERVAAHVGVAVGL